MKRDSRSPIWPLLIVLALIFSWQVRAPRAWQRVALTPTYELLSVAGGIPASASAEAEPREQLAEASTTGVERYDAGRVLAARGLPAKFEESSADTPQPTAPAVPESPSPIPTSARLAAVDHSTEFGTDGDGSTPAPRAGGGTFPRQTDLDDHSSPIWSETSDQRLVAARAGDLAPQELAITRVGASRAAAVSSRSSRGAWSFDPPDGLVSAAPLPAVSVPGARSVPDLADDPSYPTAGQAAEAGEGPGSAEIVSMSGSEAGEERSIRETAPPAEEDFLRQERRTDAVRPRLAHTDLAPAGPWAGESSLPRRSLVRENLAAWPYPVALITRLEILSELAPHHALWSQRVQRALHTLSQLDSLTSAEVAQTLAHLQDHARHGQSLAERTEDEAVRNALARAVHSLRRRLAVWQQIHDVAAARETPHAFSLSDSLQLRQVLHDLEASLENVRHRRDWMEYLQVAEAWRLENMASSLDTTAIRRIARGILGRLEYARLSPAQREFLEQPAFRAYRRELKHLAAEPVDFRGLLQHLEDYELRGLTEPAHWVAQAQQNLRWSHHEPVVRLGREVDAYYRNANFRVAFSAELLRRLMPEPDSREEPIDEHILGIRTRGSSESLTQLRVGFRPSDSSWQLRLLADGDVASLTTASQGPATFYTRGRSRFRAEKPITIDAGGIRWGRTEVGVDSDTALAGLRTDVDGVPLLGDIVQNIATRQYRSRTPAAELEAQQLLAQRVRSMLDAEVEQRIEELQGKFLAHFYRPLYHLDLNPVALEMRTTETRGIARYRLAGPHQLGAHTPRPLAPADSVLSVQMHESVVNNVIEQLGWQGRRMPLDTVYAELAQLFGLPTIQPPDDLPEDVMVRFAERNPLRLAFEDGRVRITLGLAELSQGRNRWRNFVVRVHYQPVPEDPRVDLARDQYVELMGRLGLGDQIALRGIFSRVFSREKPIGLLTRFLEDDARMHGLALTRMEIGDGWLAVAIGPKRYFRRALPLPVAFRIAD